MKNIASLAGSCTS